MGKKKVAKTVTKKALKIEEKEKEKKAKLVEKKEVKKKTSKQVAKADESDLVEKKSKHAMKIYNKVEQLKKKIKRTMSNMSEVSDKNDEMEEEKQDPTIKGDMISFAFSGNNDEEIIVKIQKRSYSFNTLSKYVRENAQLLDFINTVNEYCELLKKKELRKCPEIARLTHHYQFTALEYYLLHAVHEIKAKEERDAQEAKKPQDEKDKSTNAQPAALPPCEAEKCCICQFELYEDIQSFQASQFKKQLEEDDDEDAIGLIRCEGHYFHKQCLKMMAQSTYIKCPICSQIYGEMTGDQPDGEMTISKTNQKCSGYSCPTIVINYQMHGGNINGKYISGTYRSAYLPDNKEGREVCDLLKIAFDRKLIFTVGRSVTTGMDNQIVWNGIHHKTNLSGGSSYFGWPDDTYFLRVKEELALKGVR